MKNSLMLIKELKLVETEKSFKLLMKNYLDDGYSAENLLRNINDVSKRKIMLSMIFGGALLDPLKMIEDYYPYLSIDEKVCVFRIVLEKNPLQAYYFLKEIKNPKTKLELEEITRVINQTTTKVVINDFGSYFAEALLNKNDYYELLKIKTDLSKNVLDKIYEKSILSLSNHEFNGIIKYLNDEEKRKYARMFLESSNKNYKVAMYFLDNKIYFDDDFDKLLKIVANNAPSNDIYKVLMNENLSEKNKNMLEKGLLKTGDVEYISYYYFYKNRYLFDRLFGSTLLFLSFVMINEKLFKNKVLLEEVIAKIKTERASYSDNVIKMVCKYKKVK